LVPSLYDASVKLDWVAIYRESVVAKLDDIDAPLTAFNVGYDRLIVAHPGCDLLLM
jgi:hypothetical protein